MIDTPTRPAAVAVIAMSALLLFGCETERSGLAVSIPPPDGWAETLAAQRAAKDENFRQDPDTPLVPEMLEGFAGLEYFPPDPSYYFVGPVNLYFQPERFEIVTTTGKQRPCEKVGWVAFERDGQAHRLQVYRLLDSPPAAGDPGYFLPFMDSTTGEQTYPSGRYVDLLGPEGGPFILDFNTAYNPLCAYGAPERFVCPRTPSENRLSVAIEAGERGYRPEGAGS